MYSQVTDFDFLRPSPPQRRQLLYSGIGLLIALASVFSFWRKAVFSEAYLPHAVCYLHKPVLVWTNVVSDALIGLSYTVISLSLGYLVLKGHRDIPFRWIFLAFGLFIVACGGTHFMEVITVWAPVYVFSAGVKVFTAIVSVCTAIALPFTVPRGHALIREARVSEERRQTLELTLGDLNRARDALQRSHESLEKQVIERTSELTRANAGLKAEVLERRRIQSSLAELASIVKSTDDAIIGKDLRGIITSWNRAAERIYGYRAEEAIGRPITIIVPSNLMEEASEIMSQIADGEHVSHLETERITKSGSVLDMSLTVSPVYDTQGHIVGASTIARDITEAKRARQALRESEEQYRMLFQNNPLPMWVFERKTLRFLAVNEAAVRHYGYAREEFSRMTIRDIRPSKDIPRLLAEVANTQTGLQEMEVWRHCKKDGTIIDVEITGHDLNFQGADAELILAHDITDRLKGEERLRQSLERFAKAFRSSPFGVTISSEGDGRYLDVNPAFLRIMGYELEEMVGRTVEELNVWADPQHRALMIERLNSPQPTKPIEAVFRTQSGGTRIVEVAAERIQLDDEPCVLAITHDVTESKQLEQQFRQAQKMEAVGRLAGGIAHDFNNMMGVVIGYSEIAMERLESAHPAQKCLLEIRKAGERASTLTRQLLAFSRQQLLEPRTLNLNSVINNMSKMLLHMIGEDISLILRPTEPLGSVRADLGQIEQVVMNFAVNARDAMPKGGKIVIETANVDLDDNYVRQHQAVKSGRYIMLSFTDTGIGMNEATKARLFEPFFTTKEPGKGTGLGLSTVYGIVKQSGGYVWAYSEMGLGTTFKVYLPRVDQPAESLIKVTDERALPTGTETVLVVEDESALRDLAVSILETNGYTVLSADDSEIALAISKQYESKIDLLLTDVVMPGLTGPDLAVEIKAQRPELKVVYMSGYAGNMMLHQGVPGAELPLLTKPFSTRALLMKVRAVLDM
jgi:two-component system, cell cycle sensor histidine kinase and response regulator CckA